MDDQSASDDHLTKIRSVLSIRCFPKIASSSSTSTGSQIAIQKRSLTWTNVETWTTIFYTVDGKNVRLTTGNSSPNPVQYDISPHRHSQLSDLTMRLYSTTSLKSISLKWWLNHQMFKLSYGSVQLCRSKSRDQSFFAVIGQLPHSWRIPLLWP